MRVFAHIRLLGLGLFLAQPLPAYANLDDWQRATELMNAGRTEAALPLLERPVSENPSDKNYHFEPALALFRLKRDVRAIWHLDQVRGADLIGPEQQLVRQYLAQIAQRGVWSGSFSAALKPESNASRQTTDGTINIGGLNFTLTPRSRARPRISLVVGAGLGYSPRLTEKVKGSFALIINLRHNKDGTLRDYQVNARAGLEFTQNSRRRVAAGVQSGYRWVATQPYSDSIGLWAEYSQFVGARGQLDLGFDVTDTRHKVVLPDSRRFFGKHQL